jgi:ABC-type branched-subunit amino acid transport system permease subunit
MLARYAGYSLFIQGVILIAIMLVSPQGIVGLLQRSRHYRRVAEVMKR